MTDTLIFDGSHGILWQIGVYLEFSVVFQWESQRELATSLSSAVVEWIVDSQWSVTMN